MSAMINGAYVRELSDALVGSSQAEAEAAFKRTSPADIERRLLTDKELAGLAAGTALLNRVLFLALAEKDGVDTVIGTCT